MAGPLEGLLVIAIEQAVAAPLCTLKLAEAGARVIKIEREGGETARHYDASVHGTSSYFTWLNGGKESAVLDLKAADDLALLHRMLSRADVLVQNLAPGALDRLGLDAAALEALNPRLIAVSICGYGRETAYADMRAYDMLVQAEAGVTGLTGSPAEPAKVGVPIADIATGMNAYALILEAVLARQATGRGRQLEVAMFDSLAEWMTVPLLHYEQAGLATDRHGMDHATIYPYGLFTCADGGVILSIQNAREWERLCRQVFERPDLIDDPRFADNPRRSDNRRALDGEIEPWFAARTVEQAVAALDAADIAFARASRVEDLSTHPALRRRSVVLPTGETVLVPRGAGKTGTAQVGKAGTAKAGGAEALPVSAPAPAPVPALGQATEAVREEFS